MTSTGETVRLLRTQIGAPQRWLADEVGVSQQTIARWEGGGEIPTKYLRDLAVALGCTVRDLVSFDEPQSYLARFAARRAGRFGGDIDDAEIPFGTLRLRFSPSLREVLDAPQESGEETFPHRFEREYPLSTGERRRLVRRLDDRGDQFPTWFSFQSLDNRLVFVNRGQLESLEMVHDDIEATPPYEHEEIYRALGDWRVQQVLAGEIPIDSFDAEDAPYSRATIQRCHAFAEDVGGVDELLRRVNYVSAETTEGRVLELFSDPDDDVFQELSLLGVELDAVWTANTHQVNDWLVELGGEGWERSSLYRLGALRVIEAPLSKYLDAQQRALDEMNAHLGRVHEDGDDK